jgi:hypothetical protein
MHRTSTCFLSTQVMSPGSLGSPFKSSRSLCRGQREKADPSKKVAESDLTSEQPTSSIIRRRRLLGALRQEACNAGCSKVPCSSTDRCPLSHCCASLPLHVARAITLARSFFCPQTRWRRSRVLTTLWRSTSCLQSSFGALAETRCAQAPSRRHDRAWARYKHASSVAQAADSRQLLSTAVSRVASLLFLQVHLCGSFTRWVETVPMTALDGQPGTFTVVVHLPPG